MNDRAVAYGTFVWSLAYIDAAAPDVIKQSRQQLHEPDQDSVRQTQPAASCLDEPVSMNLVTPDQIPEWIPGTTTVDSTDAGWREITLKGYHYPSQEAAIPDMRDYMVVVYLGPPATMRCRSGGPWQVGRVGRGVVSLLTRAERSTWQWDKPIDVRHIYLGHDVVAETAARIFERDPQKIVIDNALCRPDEFFRGCATALEQELRDGGVGNRLYVESLRTQVAIHLLRAYARIELPRAPHSAFRARDRRRILEYIRENLAESFGLDDLARCVNLSTWHFSRKFKTEFGVSPHRFVVRERIERAKGMLLAPSLPLKTISADCGFADQSHFCRVFTKHTGTTPNGFRNGC